MNIIEAIQNGRLIARESWRVKGFKWWVIFLFVEDTDEGEPWYCHGREKCWEGLIAPCTLTQKDILANDWIIKED